MKRKRNEGFADCEAFYSEEHDVRSASRPIALLRCQNQQENGDSWVLGVLLSNTLINLIHFALW
jgi:hypothetical protein